MLNQDETPLLYSLVFGEGVVNDATSIVLFNAIQSFDLSHIDSTIALKFVGNFLYLFITSTLLGVLVSISHLCLSLSLSHTRANTHRDTRARARTHAGAFASIFYVLPVKYNCYNCRLTGIFSCRLDCLVLTS